MALSDWFQVGGALSEPSFTRIGSVRKKWLLCYPLGEEGSTDETDGWHWRRNYSTTKPTASELREAVAELVDAQTDEAILTGFTWNDLPVYLSSENQFNYKAAYDLAFQTDGAALPLTFKMGEEEDGTAVYYEFADMDTFADFYTKAIAYIQTCLANGWAQKDAVDYDALVDSAAD